MLIADNDNFIDSKRHDMYELIKNGCGDCQTGETDMGAGNSLWRYFIDLK